MKLSGMCQLGWGTLCFINHKAIYLKKTHTKKMGEFGGQNAHSTLNTDCESGV